MNGGRVVARIAFAALLMAAGLEMAEAASAICRSLEARLASVQRGGGQGAGAYGNAVRQQRQQIAIAERQARRAGCGTPSARNAATCGEVGRGLGRMRANLAQLERRERSASGRAAAPSGAERANLLRQLGANDCGPQYAAYSRQAQPRPRNFLERLFSPQDNEAARTAAAVPRVAAVEPPQRVRRSEQGSSGGGYETSFGRGSYRTLCVRTCDGYYFPISFGTSRSSFATDEQVCRQMCPGTDVALYAHRNPGQQSGDAVSTVDRTPYRQLATAFAYRTSYNPSCSCGKATALDLVAGGYSAVTTPGGLQPLGEPVPPRPLARPSPGEDPETLANRKGLLDAGPIAPEEEVTTPVAALAPPQDGAIRRVGPSYFYAQ